MNIIISIISSNLFLKIAQILHIIHLNKNDYITIRRTKQFFREKPHLNTFFLIFLRDYTKYNYKCTLI